MRLHFAGMICFAWFCLVPTASAADQLTPLDATGLRTELGGLKGQVVLVNFWATWCRPCLKEIPTLMQLETELRESGFRLIAVSLDEPDSAATHVKPFMDKWFPDFSSYLSIESDMDSMVSAVDPAWNEILPTSYLLARDGSVAERIQGKKSAEEFAARILLLTK